MSVIRINAISVPAEGGPELEERFRKRLARGKVECNLRFEANPAASSDLRINEELAKQVIKAASWVKDTAGEGSIGPFQVLNWPGVMEAPEQDLDAINKALLEGFNEAVDDFIAARASEGEVKRLSASGQLAQYRIVHFATHGALAGELEDTSEPGLILTPPATASKDDDGYLSASEIAALKLNADWVILSACNTAAGGATGAQALSGLARAFIYAQARALLVSHWSVDSAATVKLITTAMRELARNGKVGRAEALRRAMLVLIDKGDAHETHPANWAPFIVVGEGAR